MAGESLIYQILYDGGKLSKYLVEGSITLTPDNSINYEISWNLSVKTKKNSSIIDTFSSDKEDENFTISGQSPNEIIKDQFQGLIEDAIDSKFSELKLKENKFSYESPTNNESPKQKSRRHFFKTFGQPKENQYLGEGESSDQSFSEKFSIFSANDQYEDKNLPPGYVYASKGTARTIHTHTYGHPNGNNIEKYFTIGIYEFSSFQMVKSKIVDRDKKEPIVGATVQTSTGETTKTDKNGEFEVKIPIPAVAIPKKEPKEVEGINPSESVFNDGSLSSNYDADVKQDKPKEKEVVEATVINDYDQGATTSPAPASTKEVVEATVIDDYDQGATTSSTPASTTTSSPPPTSTPADYELIDTTYLNSGRTVYTYEDINTGEKITRNQPLQSSQPPTTNNPYAAEDALLTSKSGANINQEPAPPPPPPPVITADSKPDPPKITITSKDHEQHSVVPVTLDGNVRETMGVVPVVSNEVAMEETKREELLLPEPKIKAFQQSKTDSDMRKQIAMNKMISHIKTVLLPQALLLISAFGISKAQEFMGKKFGDMNAACPSNLKELNKLIKRKNKLTKRLNNIYKFLDRIEMGIKILDGLVTAAQVAVEVASAASLLPLLPLPPPAVVPSPPSTANKLEKARRELNKLKLLSSSVLLILEVITDLLFKILSYLNMLDSLIQGCTEEYLQEHPEDAEQIQTQVNNNLLESLNEIIQQQTEEQETNSREHKGFTFQVESINTSEVNGLQRRRALALNSQGIVMLKGEPSFSSNDKILIDELKFYINQNDLKAE
jgi:hypothetical protein